MSTSQASQCLQHVVGGVGGEERYTDSFSGTPLTQNAPLQQTRCTFRNMGLLGWNWVAHTPLPTPSLSPAAQSQSSRRSQQMAHGVCEGEALEVKGSMHPCTKALNFACQRPIPALDPEARTWLACRSFSSSRTQGAQSVCRCVGDAVTAGGAGRLTTEGAGVCMAAQARGSDVATPSPTVRTRLPRSQAVMWGSPPKLADTSVLGSCLAICVD